MPEAKMRPRVAIVSKPVSPPWTDSSKNLTRDIIQYANGIDVTFYNRSETANYQPSLMSRFQMVLELLKLGKETNVIHFLFAPNQLTSTVLKYITKFKKQVTIQTVCSRPRDYGKVKKLLFTDEIVVLSRDAESQLINAGFNNVHLVPPFIPMPDASRLAKYDQNTAIIPRHSASQIRVLYAGDYEFSQAIELLEQIIDRVTKLDQNIHFVFACRNKTKQARSLRAGMQARLRAAHLAERVTFLGEVSDAQQVIRACDFMIFPAQSLYRKMDIPLVLLEALSLERPIVVSDLAPLKELVSQEFGLVRSTQDVQGWVEAIVDLAQDPQKLKRMGKQGRAYVETHHNSETCVKSYEEIYLKALQRCEQPTEGYYDDFSKIYEKNRRQGYHQFIDDVEASLLLPYVKANSSVLEVGCGTGLILERIRAKTKRLKGIDLSSGMLNVARAKGFDVVKADACQLPFADQSFDVVCSFKVMAHVENVQLALNEVARVTKTGGFGIIEFYNRYSLRYLRWRMRSLFRWKTGKSPTREDSVYTRYDKLKDILKILPSEMELVSQRGVNVWTPAAIFMKIPLISQVLKFLEKKSLQGPLSRFGGFSVLVLRKR